MSRDFHFAHQGFSNFVCKMYVQFNKREAPFLRVPHTCSGWRNCGEREKMIEREKKREREREKKRERDFKYLLTLILTGGS